MKEQLMRQIIAKQDEIIEHYKTFYDSIKHPLVVKITKRWEEYGNEIESELSDLKQQLAESNDHQIRMPDINDYPSTDERSYINLDNTGSVNWEKYAKALIAYIKQLEDCVVAEIKTTPIPSGWICPRCQKVHSWMVQSCDCYPSVITASTTEPIPENYLNDCIEKATPNLSKIKDVDKELAEIRGKTCDSCKYGTGYYRCVTCDHYEKWEPIK